METGDIVPSNPRRKFSSIALFIVVAVVLVSGFVLLTFFPNRIRPSARARVVMEVQCLKQAMDAFRDRFGTYPPRGDPREFEQGIAKIFPRWQNYRADFKAAGLDLSKLNDSRALVFWLGGMRRKPGSTEFIGFCADPDHPLGDHPARIGPFCDFDQTRLVETEGGWLEYVVEPPPDYKPPYQFNGREVFLPGFEPFEPQR